MKTQLFFLLGFLALTLSFTSCKKDKLNEEMQEITELPDARVFFNCNLDGTAYNAAGFYAYGLPDPAKDATLVYGLQENGDVIYIQIPEILGEGEHLFSPQLFSFVTTGSKTYATHFVDTHSGKVNIISRTNDTIEGTFEFVAYNIDNENDVIEIDSGKFKVNINY